MTKPKIGLPAKSRRVEFYRTDAVVLPEHRQRESPVGGKRDVIKGYSVQSRKRLIFLLNNCDVKFTGMLTATMHPDTSEKLTELGFHTRTRRALIKQMNRSGMSHHVWVREYTKRGTLHWHIFTAGLQFSGRPDIEESLYWSGRWADIVSKLVDVPDKMFTVSCRAESVTKAAAAYLSKEGSKNVQKQQNSPDGMAWWRASRNVKCTPIASAEIDTDSLAGFDVHGDAGRVHVPYRTQFGKGVRSRDLRNLPT